MLSHKFPNNIDLKQPSALVVWTETILGTLLIPLLGVLFNRADPLFLHIRFPLLIFAPLLFGIRYGFVYGFTSALLIMGLMLIGWAYSDGGLVEYPFQYALATMVVGMIAGEFADSYRYRNKQIKILNELIKTRHDKFSRSYQLLKLSHDHLKEQMAGQMFNLHSSLIALSREFTDHDTDSHFLHDKADHIVQFMAVHNVLQQASLYEVFDNSQISPQPLASIGKKVICNSKHPMIQQCLKSKQVVSIKNSNSKLIQRHDKYGLLAVVPLVDIQGHIWAVLAISEIPFIVFHHKNLKALAVSGASLGDLISDVQRRALHKSSTDHTADFIEKISKWNLYARHYQLDVMLMKIQLSASISSPKAEHRVDQWIFDQMRVPDIGISLSNTTGGKSILIIMPLTDKLGTDGYRRRIRQFIEGKMNKSLNESLIAFSQQSLGITDGAQLIFYKACQECSVVVD